jgi:hypothetical protein
MQGVPPGTPFMFYAKSEDTAEPRKTALQPPVSGLRSPIRLRL